MGCRQGLFKMYRLRLNRAIDYSVSLHEHAIPISEVYAIVVFSYATTVAILEFFR
jgi:hypothetical protein